jgi:DNA-binding GntR family transcriptional regulator
MPQNRETAADAALTQLQSRVTRDIVAFARRDNLKAGDHLVESALAARIGTSRSPVNTALRYLARIGVLTHDLNRGYFLNEDARSLNELASRFSSQPDDPLYLRIAEERLARQLPDAVSEIDLMRRYDVSRSTLRKVLARIQKEDWIEKSVGHGWLFQPMIDSQAAYEESYVFRSAIEPVGLTCSRFRADPGEFAALRRQQQFIRDGGYATMTANELFEANCLFHETLAKWSANRFIAQGVRRADQLRRLVEYRQAAQERGPRRTQGIEHLAILDAIEQRQPAKAGELMRTHLEGARRIKVFASDIFDGERTTPPADDRLKSATAPRRS